MTPERQHKLSLKRAIKIAWRGIRIRMLRSVLVSLGIVLPIAFLTYILCSEQFSGNVSEFASEQLVQELLAKGKFQQLDDSDAVIQLRWMVGLALLISFVGIVNSMLMSVTERFREIGTMKCLGALDSFIVKLFLLESAMQGVVSATAGVLVGLILAYVEAFGLYRGETWSLLSLFDLLKIASACFSVGVALTVIGALFPATKASRMKPIDALRTEI